MTVPAQIGPDGLALLRRLEGYTSHAVRPVPHDPWTIASGCTFNLDGSPVREGQRCTPAEGEALMQHALRDLCQHTRMVIAGAATTQHQFDAMICLGYNVGAGTLAGSTLMRLHRTGQYAAAADAFELFKYSHGEVLQNLIRRRAAERALYLTP